ncbi:MAG: hypothetical protein ACM30I_08055 [Gemmatimonas sp.]
MDWNWLIGDAEFYSIQISELIAYVLLVAGVVVAIETIVGRIRGRKAADAQAADRAAGRHAHGH